MPLMATKKILTQHKGRKCKYPGCKRVLSIYNQNTYCHADLNRLSKRPQFESGLDVLGKPAIVIN